MSTAIFTDPKRRTEPVSQATLVSQAEQAEQATLAERDKYTAAWELPGYRHYSPGEQTVPHLLTMDPSPLGGVDTIIDFGTGCGRAALLLHRMGKAVTLVDIAQNCLDDAVAKVLENRLHVGCLWDDASLTGIGFADLGYCTDVMEHIPPARVDAVLQNITDRVGRAVFTIAFFDDHFGQEIGETLHLTVQPFTWWRDKLRRFGTLVHAVDMIDTGLFVLDGDRRLRDERRLRGAGHEGGTP